MVSFTNYVKKKKCVAWILSKSNFMQECIVVFCWKVFFLPLVEYSFAKKTPKCRLWKSTKNKLDKSTKDNKNGKKNPRVEADTRLVLYTLMDLVPIKCQLIHNLSKCRWKQVIKRFLNRSEIYSLKVYFDKNVSMHVNKHTILPSKHLFSIPSSCTYSPISLICMNLT